MRKLISDIRLFVSHVPNEDGRPLPDDFGDRMLTLRLRRIAMKLRERAFSLGDFDHLYVNLTPCLPDGVIQPARRSGSRETAWLRYVDIGLNEAQLGAADEAALTPLIERCLLLHAQDDPARESIRIAIAASAEGENMLMRFKEQETGGVSAVVYLRLLDSGLYHPLLRVTGPDGQTILQTDLQPCFELHALGAIRLTRSAVTIMPRKNAFTANLAPLRFPFPAP